MKPELKSSSFSLNESYREILRLAVPNTLSAVTIPLLGMVDMAILGHLETEVYLNAVAVGGVIFSFIYSLFGFLRMGTSGFVAQYFGQKNAGKQVVTLYRVLLFAGVAGVILILLRKPVEFVSFYFMDMSPGVEKYAAEYFRVRIWAAPASLGIIGITGWFTGMQNAKAPLYIALLTNVTNAVLSYFLVYHAGYRSDGVAWGSLAAQYTGFLFALGVLYHSYGHLFKHKYNEILFDWNELKYFLKVNTDILIRSVTLMFTFAFMTAASAGFGDVILGVNSILLQFLMFFAYFVDGLAYAAESLSGKYTGAKDKNGFRIMMKNVFRLGWTIAFFFALLYAVAGTGILKLLSDIPAILNAAGDYRFWVALIPLTSVAAFVYDGIFIGALASRAMRNTLLIATFLVFLPAFYLFKNILGNHSLWLALNLFMLARSILLHYYAKKSLIISTDE